MTNPQVLPNISADVRAQLEALKAGEPCRISDCSKPRKRGLRLCSMHNARLARTGTTDPGPSAHLPLEERYWRKVVKTPTGCWEWPHATNDRGYGQLHHGRTSVYVHRLSWQLHFGAIPDDLEVLHGCDNPPCSNPAHLRLGTHAENMADAVRQGRITDGWIKSGATRLDRVKVAEIRRFRAAGVPRRTVAEWFGISARHVSGITADRLWKLPQQGPRLEMPVEAGAA